MQNSLAINNTQKYLIRVYFENDIFDNIAEFDRDPKLVIRALNAIVFEGKLGKNKIRSFKKAGIWEPILEARKILAHPSPQNRTMSSITVQHPKKNFVYYESRNGDLIEERRGFFNLSIRNDETAPPIDRESVVFFIKSLIAKEIEKYQKNTELKVFCKENEDDDDEASIELCVQGPVLRFSSPNKFIDSESVGGDNEILSDISVDDDADFDLIQRADESCMRRAYNIITSCSVM